MNYVTPTIGTGAVTDAAQSKLIVPEIWSKEIVENRINSLVMWPLIDGHFSSEISQEGDVLHLNALSEITDSTATNSSVTIASTVDSLNVTQTDLLIDRYIRKALGVQDVLKAQGNIELRAPYVGALGRFLDRAKDEEVMRKAVAGFTGAKTTTGSGGAITFADIVDAATILDQANVPEGDRFIVVNGVGRGDLRKIPEFTAYKETGASGLVKSTTGFVGELYGMPVYVTNAIQTVGGSYKYLMFHRSAIIGATQAVPNLEADRDKLLGQDYIVGSELFGVKVLRPDHGVVISRTVPATSTTTTTTTV